MTKPKISHHSNKYQPKRMDLTGERYGRLVVISDAEPYISPKGIKRRKVNCICDCGNKTQALITHLRGGLKKSCGCLLVDSVRERTTTHGHSRHPLQWVYQRMKRACYNKNYAYYKDYGGRGIKICDEWDNSFESFLWWGLSNGWEKGLNIDRIDVNGNYSPENCRFVDNSINSINTRLICSNNTSGYRGVSKCRKKWSSQINYRNIKYGLGTFETKEEAARAYDAKAKELNVGHPLNFKD